MGSALSLSLSLLSLESQMRRIIRVMGNNNTFFLFYDFNGRNNKPIWTKGEVGARRNDGMGLNITSYHGSYDWTQPVPVEC